MYSLTGNVVDKFVSNASGIAASKQLPVGVYIVKEVSAPTYYALDGRELIAEIRTSGDIVRFEVLNKSLDLNLTIRKKSTSSATVGQTLKYDIYDVSNQSSAPLTNFYIHDRILIDATRVTKVVTGTYSERTYYKLTYKTNYTSEYRVLAENLLTKNSYEYSLHSNVLGLQNGEYVTDVRLEFPQVSSGFTMVDEMSVYCQVMPNIPKDYTIVNRAEVGGVYQNQWESAKASWNTTVWWSTHFATQNGYAAAVFFGGEGLEHRLCRCQELGIKNTTYVVDRNDKGYFVFLPTSARWLK